MSWNYPKVATKPKKLQIRRNAVVGGNKDTVFVETPEGESNDPSLLSDDVNSGFQSNLGATEGDKESLLASGSNSNAKEPSNESHTRESSIESNVSPERSEINRVNSKILICNDCSSSSRQSKTYKKNSDSQVDEKHGSTHNLSIASTTRRPRTPEKVPYFMDEVRERDRLRRKYGIHHSRSTSRSSYHFLNRDRAHRHRSKSRDRRCKSGDISGEDRERSRSTKTRDRYPKYRRRSEDPQRNRSRSLESITTSHMESSRSERRKYRHGEHDETSYDDLAQGNLPQTQIITIPVPVPADFLNYSYPAWPAPTQWAPRLTHPPRYGSRAAYPAILPQAIIPPIRSPFPPYGLPHLQLHYGGRGIRFPSQYGAWRPNFRGRYT